MKKVLPIIIIGILTVLNAYADSNLKADIRKTLLKASAKFNLPGIAFSMNLPNGKILNYAVGKQKLSDANPLQPDMLFQFGSITKTFTAALMLKLIQQKKCSLNDKLGKYLPEYSKWKNITIKQLLNQTSGIFDYINLPGWFPKIAHEQNKVWTLKELTDISYAHKDSFSAGQGWQYSNTNYVLAGMIIEKITGKSIKRLMRSELINRFSLTNTFYIVTNYPSSIEPNLAHGYYYTKQGKPYDMSYENTSWLGSAGGITSTPSSIAKWTGDFFRGKVVSTQLMKQALTTVSPFTGKPTVALTQPGYGLSFFRMNTPVGIMWFTPGLTSGYRSMLAYLPCKNIALAYVMTSSDMHNHGHGPAKYLLMTLSKEILKNKQIQKIISADQVHNRQPEYCSYLPKAKKFLGLSAFFRH